MLISLWLWLWLWLWQKNKVQCPSIRINLVSFRTFKRPLFLKPVSYARLITYFGNFIFGFSSLRLRDFLYDVFCLQGKMGKTKWKISKLLRNILVTLSPKTKLPKGDETLIRSKVHKNLTLIFPVFLLGSCLGPSDIVLHHHSVLKNVILEFLTRILIKFLTRF